MKLTKNMKRIIAFILVLIMLIFLPGLVLTPTFVTKHNLGLGRNAIYSRIANEPAGTIDVLVMGDSESYSSISPMQLWKNKGYTVYAAGQPGANLGDTLSVLKVALKTQKPKVILLESHSLFRDRKSTAVQKQSALAEKLYSLFPALRYHNGWKLLFPQRLTKHYKGFNVSGKCHAYCGSADYMEKDYEAVNSAGQNGNGRNGGNDRTDANQSDQKNQRKNIKLNDKVGKANIRDLESLKQICRKNGIQLVIYSAPSPKNYNYRRIERVRQICRSHGLNYVDLNAETRAMGIDWSTDTRDRGDHLNISGAMKATAYMGEYLEKNFSLADHRGDTLIAMSWDKMYQTYEAAATKNLQRIYDGKSQKHQKHSGKSRSVKASGMQKYESAVHNEKSSETV